MWTRVGDEFIWLPQSVGTQDKAFLSILWIASRIFFRYVLYGPAYVDSASLLNRSGIYNVRKGR